MQDNVLMGCHVPTVSCIRCLNPRTSWEDYMLDGRSEHQDTGLQTQLNLITAAHRMQWLFGGCPLALSTADLNTRSPNRH